MGAIEIVFLDCTNHLSTRWCIENTNNCVIFYVSKMTTCPSTYVLDLQLCSNSFIREHENLNIQQE